MATSGLSPAQLESFQYQLAHPGDNLAYQVIASNVAMGIVAVLAVVARIISRRLGGVRFAIDDYLAFSGFTFFLAYLGACCGSLYYGLGKHVVFVTYAPGLGSAFIVSECLYTLTLPCLKLSLLVLYGRIFPQKWFKICLIANAVFIVAYSLAFCIVAVAQCIPIPKNWDPTIEGTCINYSTFALVGCVTNAISDIMILVLPVPLIWKLNMKQTRRLNLIIMFTIGAFCCLSSLVRLAFVKEFITYDPTYDDIPIIVTSTVELGISCLAACVPTYTTIVNYFTGTLQATKASRMYHTNPRLVNSENQSSQIATSRKHTWHTTHEARGSDDIELVRQGGEVNTSITTYS